MIDHVCNPWFWGTVLAGAVLALICIIAACAYNSEKYPKLIKESYFDGPAKDRLSSLGIGVPLVPMLVLDEVRDDQTSMALLGASAVLMMLASVLGLWFYSSIQALPRPEEKFVSIAAPWPMAVQGAILALLFTSVVALVVFFFITPVFGIADPADARG